MAKELCFACGRPLSCKRPPIEADTRDDQVVFVGPECAKNLTEEGWQPPQGGPKLYPIEKES